MPRSVAEEAESEGGNERPLWLLLLLLPLPLLLLLLEAPVTVGGKGVECCGGAEACAERKALLLLLLL